MEIDQAFSDLDCDGSFLDESLLCLGSDDEFEVSFSVIFLHVCSH